jgi:hypothetical protein
MATISTISINGQSVNFKYGMTISDVLSKELNTGVLVVPHTSKLDIEPLDDVVITHNVNQIIRMVVAQVNAKIVNHEGQKKYTYTIGLASPTLKLQRIVLPTKTITNSLDGSDDKTIYKVIQELLQVYAQGQYLISSSLQSKTSNVTCPEFVWQRPTLFEVLNDILGVIGCVVTVIYINNQPYISLLDLYDKNNPIDETKIANYEFDRNVADYASAIEIQATNVYDEDANRTTEYVNVRTTQQAILTTNNQEIVLQKPIFKIKKVIAKIVSFDDVQTFETDVDITNRVVEQQVYDTFYNSNAAGRLADTSTKKYRRNYIYFQQGSNVISGLDYREDIWIPYSNGTTALNNILYWNYGVLPNSNTYTFGVGMLHDIILFYIEYVTADDISFRVLKTNAPRNASVLINNQNNAEVYAKSLGKQQQEFVNRIGNEQMVITGRYTNYADIPVLNDYIDDYILTQREIAFFDGFYNFKGTLSQGYANDNMFAGINTARRFTEIASPSKALLSNHITLTTLKFSGTSNSSNETLENYFLQVGRVNERLQGCIIQTITEQSFDAPQFAHTTSPMFMVDGSTHQVGNSVIFNVRMVDNANVGLSLDEEFVALFNSVQSIQKNSYVNDLGRFFAIALRLYKKGGITNKALDNLDITLSNGAFGYVNLRKGAEMASKYPIVTNQEEYFIYNPSIQDGQLVTYNPIDETKKVFSFSNTGPFNVGGLLDYKARYKDNREITSETLQFHFTKDNGIFFTDKFLEYCPFIFDGSTDLQYRVAYSFTETYNENDTRFKGTLEDAPLDFGKVNAFVLDNYIRVINTPSNVTWFNTNAPLVTSWALCDDGGNIIVARNGNLNQRIYLNVV